MIKRNIYLPIVWWNGHRPVNFPSVDPIYLSTSILTQVNLVVEKITVMLDEKKPISKRTTCVNKSIEYTLVH